MAKKNTPNDPIDSKEPSHPFKNDYSKKRFKAKTKIHFEGRNYRFQKGDEVPDFLSHLIPNEK